MTVLVLSDVHLARGHDNGSAAALTRVLREHPGAELILAGDIFDLSLERADTSPREALSRVLDARPEAKRALSDHLARGGKLTFVVGNHDAALEGASEQEHLSRLLGASGAHQLEVSPWFVERGSVHVQHGHLYDPDCRSGHPLAPHDPHIEGLGTALMRRFVAPNDAYDFAHAHETTPLGGVRRAFELFGVRAPLVIGSYFHTAISLCSEAASRKRAFARQKAAGAARLRTHASELGRSSSELDALVSGAAEPTHESFRATFRRLFFDRMGTAAGLAAGLGMAAYGQSEGNAALRLAGASFAAVSGAYLAWDLGIRHSQNDPGPVELVAAGAELVREVTGSRLVVFGHTHVEVTEPGYLNSGSFGFGRSGRPYLLLDEDGRYERRYA